MLYPDGTNKQTYNSATSAKVISGTNTVDPLATSGTTLSTDSVSTWTSGLTYKYYVDVDTSGDAGADCMPMIFVFVATDKNSLFRPLF